MQIYRGPLETTLQCSARGMEIARVGWGSCDEVSKLTSVAIPNLWLCGGNGELPAICHRFFVTKAQPVLLDGKCIGAIYEDENVRWLLITGILPSDTSAPPRVQTDSVFQNLEKALQAGGMEFANVARTWLYMDEILKYYGVLNVSRDEFFTAHNVFGNFVPASTGIGTANSAGAILAACALAIQPKNENVKVEMVDSPLQCSALKYRSSFSRAVEVSTPLYRQLFISGTASILPDSSNVAFVGDIDKQIECTMRAVEAILESRGMNFKMVTRAIVYLKKPEFHEPWQKWLKKNKLTNFAEEIIADVCRDEWLFEIEVDALFRVCS